MNVKDLNGNIYDWHIVGNINKSFNKSSYHIEARNLLKKIYPTMQVLEEVPIKIRKSETLYLDFYIPLNKKCIEVNGEQHYKFTPYYHNNKLAFLRSQKRDKDKREWCEINNICCIELPYNEIANWETIIAEH
jgi:hypothetical protein